MIDQSTQKIRIGLDIDGVLADFGTYFLEYLQIEDKTPPKMWDDPRFEENFKRIRFKSDFWFNIPPLFNVKLLKHLGLNITHYCTARPLSQTETTLNWLWKNNFPYATLINCGETGKKSNYLITDSGENLVDLFIDDGMHNYEDLNKHGIITYLMSRSHNEHEQVDKRINDITDIIKIIK